MAILAIHGGAGGDGVVHRGGSGAREPLEALELAIRLLVHPLVICMIWG